MDLLSLSKGLDFCKKNKKWVLLSAFVGVSTYGAFRVYKLPSVTKKTRRLFKLLTALFSVAELIADSAETMGVVFRDMKEFLKSDCDEIPRSLTQISKLARSDEFSDSVTRVSEALTVGIMRAYGSEMRNDEGNVSSIDKIMDRIFSTAGTGFFSAATGSFARNLVLGFYSNGENPHVSNGNTTVNAMTDRMEFSSLPSWVTLICADRGKDFVASCIQVFVSTAVAVYLDKTMDINTFDDMFSGLTNPNHENKMRDVLVSVCNGAVETLVKTSHRVLTSKNTNSIPSLSSGSSAEPNNGIDLNQRKLINGNEEPIHVHLTDRLVPDEIQGGGWSSMVSSTLSVPSNRKFVLDVTGRVTFETVRSAVEFLHLKICDGLKSSSNVVHDCVVDKGRVAIRYFGLKSYVCITICFALLLHMICRTRALLPA